MHHEQADACTCRVCLGEWPEPEASFDTVRLVYTNPKPPVDTFAQWRKAFASEVKAGYFEPLTELLQEIVDTLALAEERLAAFRNEALKSGG